jgi:hypothetical protein
MGHKEATNGQPGQPGLVVDITMPEEDDYLDIPVY